MNGPMDENTRIADKNSDEAVTVKKCPECGKRFLTKAFAPAFLLNQMPRAGL